MVLIVPCITCVEVWGNTYKTNTNSIFMLQKQAIKIVIMAQFYDSTDPLFIKYVLKFKELVDLKKTQQIMFRVKQGTLPNCIQRFFAMKENRYPSRGNDMFKKKMVNVKKQMCDSKRGQFMEQLQQ